MDAARLVPVEGVVVGEGDGLRLHGLEVDVHVRARGRKGHGGLGRVGLVHRHVGGEGPVAGLAVDAGEREGLHLKVGAALDLVVLGAADLLDRHVHRLSAKLGHVQLHAELVHSHRHRDVEGHVLLLGVREGDGDRGLGCGLSSADLSVHDLERARDGLVGPEDELALHRRDSLHRDLHEAAQVLEVHLRRALLEGREHRDVGLVRFPLVA